MTEKMIPLSVVDALISTLKKDAHDPLRSREMRETIHYAVSILLRIKKEAIPNPLEQRIQDRIAELQHDYDIWNKQAKEESENGFYISSGDMAREAECLEKQIDELRKLLK